MVNLAAALERRPAITAHSRLVAMAGSVRRGHPGAETPDHEYNLATDPAVFESDWPNTITPLDTCGTVIPDGHRFARLRASTDPLVQAVIENPDRWCGSVEWFPPPRRIDPATSSSILYDTVAVQLAADERHLGIEALPLVVDDRGATRS